MKINTISLVAGIGFLWATYSASVEAADSPVPSRALVISATKNALSPPLRNIPPIQLSGPSGFREIPRQPLPKGGPKDRLFLDPVLQGTPGGFNMPSPTSFEGVNNVNGVLPPDTNGDVGPNHYVQWVNLSFAIYDRSGNKLLGPLSGNSIWQNLGGVCADNNSGDPIVLYDHLADRWFMSQLALPDIFFGPYYQCVAVSKTPDPTGSWYLYEFKISDTKLNDYPKFGVGPEGYYMTINQFTCDLFCLLGFGFSWAGQGVVAFERDKMLNGSPANQVSMIYFDLFSVDPNLGGMLPADLDGPPPPLGSSVPFVQMDDDAWGYSPDQLQIWQFHVDWSNPSASTFALNTKLVTAAFDSNLCDYTACIPQPGGSKLDTLSDRLMYRLQYRYFGDHQSLVVNHTVDADGTDHAGIRWYELRNTAGSGWGIFQQGTYAPDSEHRWMGSIAMDSLGNIALGYSTSSVSTFPSIRYAGRLSGDPLGQLPQGENEVIAGFGSQTDSSGRWGDYSMMGIDPTDDCTFWYTQEYYTATSAAGWQTRVGFFKFPSCGPTLTTPAITISDVSVTEGNSGTVNANFTVSLSFASADVITVQYATADGTASEGIDYRGQSGTLTFSPGETSKTVTVSVIGDTLYESDETFFVNLSNAINATIAKSQGVGTILNDDPTPGSITVISPNGGETWPVRSKKTINWTSSGVGGNVNVELSRNGSNGPWESLFSNTVNDGSEVWRVSGSATNNARVRVCSNSGTPVCDISDAAFTIK